MKICPFIASYIYAILQQIYVEFRLDLEIYVLLIKYWHSTKVDVRFS